MTTGQHVEVRMIGSWSGKTIYEGEGTVVAFVIAATSAEGAVNEMARIVVQCADGRFRFCTTGQVRVLEAVAA